MNFVNRAKLLFKNSYFEEYIRRFISGDDVPGDNGISSISTNTALKYSAVFSCNRVLSETLASTPIMEYRKKQDGTRDPTNDTPAYDILHNRPNQDMAPFNFKEACMGAINLGGNSVSHKLVNKFGELVGLYPYEWQHVDIKKEERLVYTILDGRGQPKLQRNEVFHIPGPSLNGLIGLTPLEYIAGAVSLGLSYEDFGRKFYRNGVNSSGAFSFPNELTDPAFQRLKTELKTNYAGAVNIGVPMLLEMGGKFEPFAMKPADAQLIENKHFQIEDICRFYRVPQHLVQMLTESTNNNIEHQSLEFVMYTMLPHFKRWEENINAQLLTSDERRAGYFMEFNIGGLLRGDQKSRADAYAAGRQWGWLSVNDIRRLENMSPISNGNIYLTPSNMYEAGKEPSQQQQQDKTKALAEEIFKMIQEKG